MKLERLGSVSSLNASLSMLITDARVAAAWRGIDDDGEESDCERASVALGDETTARIEVDGTYALVASLQMGQGIAHVFRVDEGILLVEGFLRVEDDSPILLAHLGSTIDEHAERGETIAVTSSVVVLTCITDEAEDGLRVKLANGTYRARVEVEKDGPWGTTRRMLLTRTV